MNTEKKVLVVFDEKISESINKSDYAEVLLAKDFVAPGSIYEASAFVEELSKLRTSEGTLVPKSYTYKDYELWWIHYNDLFYYFGLPFAQYKNLLNKIKSFEEVDLHKPPFRPLFEYFLKAHGCKVHIITPSKTERILPFGVLLQILLTTIFIPFLIIKRPKVLVFAGDKFEKDKDFDFRMRFVYKELRDKKIPFVEFIRSLEPWRIVVDHAKKRKRPVVYSEAILFVGKFLSYIFGKNVFLHQNIYSISNSEVRFKHLVAEHYIRSVYRDIWAIRISTLILKLIGVKAAYFSAALDRNYPAVLGCKLNNIPTVGILHGVASKAYNGYDFLPGFNGQKRLSLDKYGVWSDWWKEYYIKHGSTYKPDQIYVSGPMRPIEKENNQTLSSNNLQSGPIKVLFVSEQLAVPQEVLPYMETLLKQPDIDVTFTFRQAKDGFKEWLLKNKPGFLDNPRIKIATGGLPKAIEESEVAVGSHSTAALEMLLKEKVPLFFNTQKWGDYYDLRGYDSARTFFAENPEELVEKIRKIRTIPRDTLLDLQKRYFGDPYQNGSKWVVDELVRNLK